MAGIAAVLVAVLVPLVGSLTLRAEKGKFLSQLRSLGVGVNLYKSDHASALPGPLWPGQVAEFSEVETGRLVVRLAPYLGVEEKSEPYVVDRFLPASFRAGLPGVPANEIRVLVMNTAVPVRGGGTVNPWGTLLPATNAPMRDTSQWLGSEWMLSEAYRTHPGVASRPWRDFTVVRPLYGTNPLGLFFDGSAGYFNPRERR